MTSGEKIKGIITVPFVILSLVVIFKWGPVPNTMITIVILASMAILLPRIWDFLKGNLGEGTLLSNFITYSLLIGLIYMEYVFLEENVHGYPKEDIMFLTAWSLMMSFEFLWPGFAKRSKEDSEG